MVSGISSDYMRSVSASFDALKSNTQARQGVIRTRCCDAKRLQSAFAKNLSDLVTEALSGLQPSSKLKQMCCTIAGEFETLLSIVLTFSPVQQQYGDRIVGLAYGKAAALSLLHKCCRMMSLVFPFIIEKLSIRAAEGNVAVPFPMLLAITNALDICAKALVLCGILVRQCSGQFKGVLDRACALELAETDQRVERARTPVLLLRNILSGEIISLFEFYATIFENLQTRVKENILLPCYRYIREAARLPLTEESADSNHSGSHESMLGVVHCMVCFENPVQLPLTLHPCKHRACYYCIMQLIAEDVSEKSPSAEDRELLNSIATPKNGSMHLPEKVSLLCKICESMVLHMTAGEIP